MYIVYPLYLSRCLLPCIFVKCFSHTAQEIAFAYTTISVEAVKLSGKGGTIERSPRDRSSSQCMLTSSLIVG